MPARGTPRPRARTREYTRAENTGTILAPEPGLTETKVTPSGAEEQSPLGKALKKTLRIPDSVNYRTSDAVLDYLSEQLEVDLFGTAPHEKTVLDANGNEKLVIDVGATQAFAKVRRRQAKLEGEEWTTGALDDIPVGHPKLSALYLEGEKLGLSRTQIDKIARGASETWRRTMDDYGLLAPGVPPRVTSVEGLRIQGEVDIARDLMKRMAGRRRDEARIKYLEDLPEGASADVEKVLELPDADISKLTPPAQAAYMEAMGWIRRTERDSPSEWFARNFSYPASGYRDKLDRLVDSNLMSLESVDGLGLNSRHVKEFLESAERGVDAEGNPVESALDRNVPFQLADALRENASVLRDSELRFAWLHKVGETPMGEEMLRQVALALDGKRGMEELPGPDATSVWGVDLRAKTIELREYMLTMAERAQEAYTAYTDERIDNLSGSIERSAAEIEMYRTKQREIEPLSPAEQEALNAHQTQWELDVREQNKLFGEREKAMDAFSNESYFTHLHWTNLRRVREGAAAMRNIDLVPEKHLSRFFTERTDEDMQPIYDPRIALDVYIPSASRSIHIQPVLDLISKLDSEGAISPKAGELLAPMINYHLGRPRPGAAAEAAKVGEHYLDVLHKTGEFYPAEYSAVESAGLKRKVKGGFNSVIRMKSMLWAGPLDLMRAASAMSAPDPASGKGKLGKSAEAAANLARIYTDMIRSQPEVARAMLGRYIESPGPVRDLVRRAVPEDLISRIDEDALTEHGVFEGVLRAQREHDALGVKQAEGIFQKIQNGWLLGLRLSTTWGTGTTWSAAYKQAIRTGEATPEAAAQWGDMKVRTELFEGGAAVGGFQARSALADVMPLMRHNTQFMGWAYNQMAKNPEKYVATIYMIQALGLGALAKEAGFSIYHLMFPSFGMGPLIDDIAEINHVIATGKWEEAPALLWRALTVATRVPLEQGVEAVEDMQEGDEGEGGPRRIGGGSGPRKMGGGVK